MKAACRKAAKWFVGKFVAPLVKAYTLPFADLVAKNLALLPGNPAHEIFARNGFHLLRQHYYSCVPEVVDTPAAYYEHSSELPGLDMNEAGGLALLADVFPKYMPEFRAHFPIEAPANKNPALFHLINGAYMAIDSHVYYAFIRHFKPRRIVEIGSGNSTLLAATACLENLKETGRSPHLTAIEPYPWELLKQGLPGLTELIPKKVQEVDPAVFEALEAGDILFIDSSHVLRAGNDVELEYLEILPRLKPGVLVHIHDVSLPRRYPKCYFDMQLYWNEQQLLQAFLCYNSGFEVIWPGNYMLIKHPAEVLEVFPEFKIMRQHYPASEPSAFWMRRK